MPISLIELFNLQLEIAGLDCGKLSYLPLGGIPVFMDG
jgi:hypothetical protein